MFGWDRGEGMELACCKVLMMQVAGCRLRLRGCSRCLVLLA
jgi:hypothetical protein